MKIENVFDWEEIIMDECKHPYDDEETTSAMEQVMLVRVDSLLPILNKLKRDIEFLCNDMIPCELEEMIKDLEKMPIETRP